jgi:hypothetical protein
MIALPLADVTEIVVQRPEYYLGWGTLTLINAGLAQAKNRSGLAWWLVSLLLGPFATFLIVVLDKVPETPRPEPRS